MPDHAHESKASLRKLPGLPPDHTCFGAGPANDKGLRLEFYTDEKRVYSEVVVPAHMNSWQGLVHGGIVGTILDEIMFYTALCFCKKIALTREATVKLHRPARMDRMPFWAVGELIRTDGDTGAVAGGRLYTADGQLCAQAEGSFGLIKSHIIGRLGILTDADIRMIREVIARM